VGYKEKLFGSDIKLFFSRFSEAKEFIVILKFWIYVGDFYSNSGFKRIFTIFVL